VSARYRFIAYSRRYHWPNPPPGNSSEYSVAVHAKDLAGFIRAIHGGAVHLVSTSYGSQVALVVALEHPELVRSLTLSEPGLGNLLPDTPEAKAQASEFGRSFAPVREAIKAGNSLLAVQLMVDAALGAAGSAASLSEREREVMAANAATIAPQMTSTSRVTISCTQLSTIKAPALVIGGDASPGYMKLTNDAMARCLPSGTMNVVVPKSRHLSHSMNPAFYNEILLTFLAKH
jgi:pimeloyl-ACP methyl ester carboxylesterase